MKKTTILLVAALCLPVHAESDLPSELQDLVRKRQREEEKLQEQFSLAVEKLKMNYARKGDLDAANAAVALLEGKKGGVRDRLVGTSWRFLGVNKQRLNEFEFMRDGSVKCDHAYPEATWTRLDDKHILFRYAPGAEYIVFFSDGEEMKGFHSGNGRVRYLARIK